MPRPQTIKNAIKEKAFDQPEIAENKIETLDTQTPATNTAGVSAAPDVKRASEVAPEQTGGSLYVPSISQRLSSYRVKDGDARVNTDSKISSMLGMPYVTMDSALQNAKSRAKDIEDAKDTLVKSGLATASEKAYSDNPYRTAKIARADIAINRGRLTPDGRMQQKMWKYEQDKNSDAYIRAKANMAAIKPDMDSTKNAVDDMSAYLSGSMPEESKDKFYSDVYAAYPSIQAAIDNVEYLLGIADKSDEEGYAEYKADLRAVIDEEIRSVLESEQKRYNQMNAQYNADSATVGKTDALLSEIRQYVDADNYMTSRTRKYADRLLTEADYQDYAANVSTMRKEGTDYWTTPMAISMLLLGKEVTTRYGVEFSDAKMSEADILAANGDVLQDELDMAKAVREWGNSGAVSLGFDTLADVEWRINWLEGQIALNKGVQEYLDMPQDQKALLLLGADGAGWTDEKKDIQTLMTDLAAFHPFGDYGKKLKEKAEETYGSYARGADLVRFATEAEKAIMTYLKRTDEKAFEAAKGAMHDVLSARTTNIVEQNAQAIAQKNPVLSAIISTTERLNTLADIPSIVATAMDKTKDVNQQGTEFLSTRSANVLRGTSRQALIDKVNSNIGKALVGAIFDVATTAMDSAFVAATGGSGTAVLAASGFTSSALDALERDANDTEMLWYAGLSTLAEYATEKIAWDSYTTAIGMKSKAAYLVAGIPDAVGEAASELSTAAADNAIAYFTNSRYRSAREELISSLVFDHGYTVGDAERIANEETAKSAVYASFLGYVGSEIAYAPHLYIERRSAKANAVNNAKVAISSAENASVKDVLNDVFSGLHEAAIEEDAINAYNETLQSRYAPDKEGIVQAAIDDVIAGSELVREAASSEPSAAEDAKAMLDEAMSKLNDAVGESVSEIDVSELFTAEVNFSDAVALFDDLIQNGAEKADIDAAAMLYKDAENRSKTARERILKLAGIGTETVQADSISDASVEMREKAANNSASIIDLIADSFGEEKVKDAYSAILDISGSAKSADTAMQNLMLAVTMPQATKSYSIASSIVSGEIEVNRQTMSELNDAVQQDANNKDVIKSLDAAFTDYDLGRSVMQMVVDNGLFKSVSGKKSARDAAYESLDAAGIDVQSTNDALANAKAEYDNVSQGGGDAEALTAAYKKLVDSRVASEAALVNLDKAKQKAMAAQDDLTSAVGSILSDARQKVAAEYVAARDAQTAAAKAASISPTAETRQTVKTPENAENLASDGVVSDGAQNVAEAKTGEAGAFANANTDTPEHMRQWGRKGAQNSFILFDEVKKRVYENSEYTPESAKARINTAIEQIGDMGYEEAKSQWLETGFFQSLSADYQAMGTVLMTYAAVTGDATGQADLALHYNEIGTEVGRALQARKLFDMITPEGAVIYAKRIESRINQKYAKDGRSTRVKLSDAMIERIMKANDADARKAAVKDAVAEVASQMPPTIADRLNALRYTAMLGNPRTIFRNLLGNVSMLGMQATKNKVGAVIENFAQKAGLIDERTKTVKLFVEKDIHDFAVADAKKHIESLMETGKWNSKDLGDVDAVRRKFGKSVVGNALNWWSQKTADAMDWGDRIFMKGYYTRALAGYLSANNIDPATATETVLNRARNYAAAETVVAAFREESNAVKALNQMSRTLKNGNAISKAIAIGIEGVLPFKKTPVNILKQGMRYSPLGIVKALTADLYQVQKKSMSATQMIDNLAAGLTGSMMSMVGYGLKAAGLLIGKIKDDEEWNALTGNQEYSLLIDGQSFTIDWLSPGALPMFVGAAIYDSVNDADDTTVMDAIASIAEPMMNMTMLDSLNDILSGASYSENGVAGVAADVLTSYLLQYVPAISGQAARTFDSTRRTFVADENSELSKDVQYFIYRVQSRIPGLSTLLEPYVDLWGREKSYDTFSAITENALENFILPGYFEDTSLDAVEKALEALNEETGEDVFPTRKKNKFTVKTLVDGEYVSTQVSLTPEEYTQYKKDVGSLSYNYVQQMIKMRDFSQLTPSVQVDCVKTAYSVAAAKALSKALPESTVGLSQTMTGYLESNNPVNAIVKNEKQASLDAAATNARNMAKEAIKTGDYESLSNVVTAMEAAGRTESSMRSSISSMVKEYYHDAFQRNDTGEMELISKTMIDLGIGYSEDTFKGWRREWYKKGEGK